MSEHLVVVSKVKKIIKDKAGMNTSAQVMDELTKIVQVEIDRAINKARGDNRKTVLERDFTCKEPDYSCQPRL